MTSKVDRRRPIYVESFIRAPIERIWEATQDLALHRRWDVRFGTIAAQPSEDGGPHRFTYATTVAPGVTIGGTGESLGDRNRPGDDRWSGLRFWSSDRRSIIERGAGYWRYLPTSDGVRFLTRYDYRPRWGRLGEIVDRHLFRPAFGWATAWSFDRLRVWLEDGTPPERSRDLAIAHASAVAGIVGVLGYQGIVPKLWHLDGDELAIWQSLGLSPSVAKWAVRGAGLGEVALGAAVIIRSDRRWPFAVALAAMPVLAAGAAVADPPIYTRAFSPAPLGLAVAALAVVALVTTDGRPSGRRPLRVAPDHQPEQSPDEMGAAA